MSLPALVLVPDPALVIRRAELGNDATVSRLVGEVRRIYTDAGAIAG